MAYRLPSSQPIIQFIELGDSAYIVGSDGQLWEQGEMDDIPQSVDSLTGVQIKQLECAGEICIALSNQGMVFSWGIDPEVHGVLGVADLYSTDSPTHIPRLSRIVQISVSTTHAASIDDQGLLYTWGSCEFGELGDNVFKDTQKLPAIVEQAKIFACSGVSCSTYATAICTEGGYAYIYGSIGKHKRKNGHTLSSPRKQKNTAFTISGLDQYFVQQVWVEDDYAAVLTDTGEGFIFDDCKDLILLPTPAKTNIVRIQCLPACVLGFTSNPQILMNWHRSELIHSHNDLLEKLASKGEIQSPLNAWVGDVLCPEYCYQDRIEQAISCSEYIAILAEDSKLSDTFAHCVSRLHPDRLQKFILSILKNSPESVADTLDEAISIRLNSEQQEGIAGTLVPLVNGVLQKTFSHVREYSQSMKIYRKTLANTLMPSLMLKIYTKYRNNLWAKWLSILRSYSQFVEIKARNRQHQVKVTQQFKEEACKALMRVINSAIKIRGKVGSRVFMSIIKSRHQYNHRKQTRLMNLWERLSELAEAKQKQSLEKWKDAVIRFYIAKQGVKKTASMMLLHILRKWFAKMRTIGYVSSQQCAILKKVIYRRESKFARNAKISRFATWKDDCIHAQIYKKAKMDICQVFGRSLTRRVGKHIHQLVASAFEKINKSAKVKKYNTVLKYPLMFLCSLLQKHANRVQNFAFNKTVRLLNEVSIDSNIDNLTPEPPIAFEELHFQKSHQKTMSDAKTEKDMMNVVTPTCSFDSPTAHQRSFSATSSYKNTYISDNVTDGNYPTTTLVSEEESSGFQLENKLSEDFLSQQTPKVRPHVPLLPFTNLRKNASHGRLQETRKQMKLSQKTNPTRNQILQSQMQSIMHSRYGYRGTSYKIPDVLRQSGVKPPWRSPGSPQLNLHTPRRGNIRQKQLEYYNTLQDRKKRSYDMKNSQNEIIIPKIINPPAQPSTQQSASRLLKNLNLPTPYQASKPTTPHSIESLFIQRREKQRATIGICSVLERMKNIRLVTGMYRIKARPTYQAMKSPSKLQTMLIEGKVGRFGLIE